MQRAPFIVLSTLDISAIALRYKSVLRLPKQEAVGLAKLTRGYAFAFQVLGKLYFDKSDLESLDDIIERYESELIIYSYNKIWSELSDNDKIVIKGMVSLANGEPVERKRLMEQIGFSSALMNRYQARLKEKGVLSTAEYGKYSLSLPLFSNFVRDYCMDDDEE